jgi:hypothetical protein
VPVGAVTGRGARIRRNEAATVHDHPGLLTGRPRTVRRARRKDQLGVRDAHMATCVGLEGLLKKLGLFHAFNNPRLHEIASGGTRSRRLRARRIIVGNHRQGG